MQNDSLEITINSAPPNSLKKHYFAKISANLIGVFVSFTTQALIPRGLGPIRYGDFQFLSNFFLQLTNFLDMGSSSALFTKISQRPHDHGLFRFYLWVIFGISVSTVLIVFGILFFGLREWLWPGQYHVFIFLAATLGIITWLGQVIGSVADALGMTVSLEIWRVAHRLLSLVFIVILFIFSNFNLGLFFGYQILIGIIWILLITRVLLKNETVSQCIFKSEGALNKYLKDFFDFCFPLLTYSLVGLIGGIFDRWLLQIFAGSIQQGFFGLSFQIGSICFLFSGAMTPLITREYAKAFQQKNIPAMAILFRRTIPTLYSLAAFFACFVMVQAKNIILLIAGHHFGDAVIPVIVMAAYPIHQTYGQLSGSLFLATGQTRLYRNIGIAVTILGLFLTYFFIAPSNFFGLGWGATGLALKIVFLQIIAVNIYLYFNAKLLHLNFRKFVGHQFISIAGFLGLAWAATSFISQLTPFQSVISNFLTSGILYSLISIIISLKFPRFFGFHPQDIAFVNQWISRFLHNW